MTLPDSTIRLIEKEAEAFCGKGAFDDHERDRLFYQSGAEKWATRCEKLREFIERIQDAHHCNYSECKICDIHSEYREALAQFDKDLEGLK